MRWFLNTDCETTPKTFILHERLHNQIVKTLVSQNAAMLCRYTEEISSSWIRRFVEVRILGLSIILILLPKECCQHAEISTQTYCPIFPGYVMCNMIRGCVLNKTCCSDYVMCNMISGCVLSKTYCSDKTYCTNLVLLLSSTQFNSADTEASWMKYFESMESRYIYFSLIH